MPPIPLRPFSTKYQAGYVLLITPLVIIGIVFLSYRMITKAKTSIKVASSDLDHIQSELCAKQCGSVEVNQATLDLNSDRRLEPGSGSCLCRTDSGQDPITCSVTRTPSSEASRLGCYGLKFQYNQLSLSIDCGNQRERNSLLEEQVELGQYPVFQFAIFYDGPLEFQNAPPMNIQGRVHSNDTILFLPRDDLSFDDWITAVGPMEVSPRVNDGTNGPVYFPLMDGSGPDAAPVGTSAKSATGLQDWIPDFKNWKKRHRVAFKDQENGCDAVTRITPPLKGIGENHVIIDWRSPADANPTLIRQKYAYRASLIFKSGWEDGNLLPVALSPDPVSLPADPVFATMPGPQTRVTFWEPRDELMVGLIPIDVLALQQRSADSIIYLYDSLPAPGPGYHDAGGFLLFNGARLLRRLTIVTNTRLMLLGDFNTDSGFVLADGSRSPYPAALISDVMVQLSPWFQPSEHTLANHPGNGFGSEMTLRSGGGEVTLNACVMTGMVKYNGTQLNQGGYNNFVRTMEDWDGTLYHKSGAMACLWNSNKSQGRFKIFSAPKRDFHFDPMYNSLENMPPGTLHLVTPALLTYDFVRH